MSNPRLYWIDPDAAPDRFPEISLAMTEPDGLLAVGGDLSSDRLLAAYERGIFPWYVEGQPILWWSPDPRCVMHIDAFHVARRLSRDMRKSPHHISFNRAFASVLTACAEPRDHQNGTWITDEMARAYIHMHELGWAHSAEVWDGESLVGGIYGLAIGRVFFGESMFSRETNASKFAFLALTQALKSRQYAIIDCQVESPHLLSLGASRMPRKEFAMLLRRECTPRTRLEDLPKALIPVAEYAP